MSRTFFTLLALWSLLLVPSLCVAGTLEHLCGECPEETGCGHEEDCLDDPCDVVVVATGLRVVDWKPALLPVPTVLWAYEPAETPVFETADAFPEPPSLCTRRLPYPESSLPLLI